MTRLPLLRALLAVLFSVSASAAPIVRVVAAAAPVGTTPVAAAAIKMPAPAAPAIAAPLTPLSLAPAAALNAAPALAPITAPAPSLAPALAVLSAAPAAESVPPVDEGRAKFDGARVPETRRDETVVDDYFGTKVADPYRWLEDDNSEETKAWVKAQNAHTESWFAGEPSRARFAARLSTLMNYDLQSAPTKRGRWWVYEKKTGLQNQEIIYKSRRLHGAPEVLLDPNTLSSDGTVAVGGTVFSRDGRYMAYSLSSNGSDWSEWRVREVETGRDLPDVIRWSKFGGPSWLPDGSGFYYSRFPQPPPGEERKGKTENQKVYFHKLGDAQEKDALVFENPAQPEWGYGVSVSDDGRWAFLYQHEGTEQKNRLYAKDLRRPGGAFKPVFDGFDAEYEIVGTKGDTLYVKTTKDAPRGRLIAVDARDPRPGNWRDVLPQDPKAVLDGVRRLDDGRFVAVWSKDAHQTVKVYGPRGGFGVEVKLPGIGSIGELTEDAKFLQYTSYNHPRTIFQVNLETGRLRAFKRPKVDFDPSRYEVKQVFYPSKDGTKIPMFIVHKKGLKLDGSGRPFLYSYGGFRNALTPSYGSAMAAWLEAGEVFAVANLRGGGEYGQDWHDAGRGHNKQNTFDDKQAAIEFLVREGYGKAVAINGGSNGGLTVGATEVQAVKAGKGRLIAAAVPEVGVLDMLRFHMFTIGGAWRSDYLSSETKAGFDTLIKYSPVHNAEPGDYPPTLVMTSDHDDRVVPAHSHKFTAALQRAQTGTAPILTRIEENAGHGAGTPTAKLIAETADKLAFIWAAFEKLAREAAEPKS